MSYNNFSEFLNKKKMESEINENMTTTENGALAHDGTGSKCLDLFVKSVRTLENDDLIELMSESWIEDPVILLKIIYNTRDCRTGKGERDLFFNMALWLRKNYFETYKLNLNHLINYGRFKDLLDITFLVYESKDYYLNKDYELNLLIDQLIKDRLNLDDKKDNISLAAKWCPTKDNNKIGKYNLTNHFILLLFMKLTNEKEKYEFLPDYSIKEIIRRRHELYRKIIISPLREHLNITEIKMSANQWHDIDFSHVPSQAMKKYKKAFNKHEPERLQEYLSKVNLGEAKINVSTLTPYDLLKNDIEALYNNTLNPEIDSVIETQWNELIKKGKSENMLENTLSIVDVSGSMNGQPLHVAISMGLYTSLICDENDHYYRKFITFSEDPTFHCIEGDNLADMIKNIRTAKWGYNTNFNKVFKLILEDARKNEISNDKMPKQIIVYTDMQFDTAVANENKTNFEVLKEMYEEHGYTLPNIVFWNLRDSSSNAMPVTKDENNVAYLSGFSQTLLQGLMSNNINPYQIMINILDKYEVYIANEDLN